MNWPSCVTKRYWTHCFVSKTNICFCGDTVWHSLFFPLFSCELPFIYILLFNSENKSSSQKKRIMKMTGSILIFLCVLLDNKNRLSLSATFSSSFFVYDGLFFILIFLQNFFLSIKEYKYLNYKSYLGSWRNNRSLEDSLNIYESFLI